MALIRAISGWRKLPPQLFDLTFVNLMCALAWLRGRFAASRRAPLRFVEFGSAVVRRAIAIRFGLVATVVRQSLAPHRVRTIVRFASSGIHLAPRVAIANVFTALSLGTIRLASVRLTEPPSLVRLWLCRVDDRIKPLRDRHAGPARGVACRGARFRTEAFQIPRTARFHFHVQSPAEP